MFLNTPAVKKLFKKAFNGMGLVVARPNEELIYITGSGWQIEMDYETMPFKQKAQLIELLGELPEVGNRISATKKEQQYESCTGELLLDDYMDAKILVLKAPIVIARSYMDYQLLQEQERDKFLAVNRELISIIDVREIDFENEGMPSGPCMKPNGNALYWHNGAGTLCIQLEELDKEAVSIVELFHGLKVRRES